jgi:hypothetical protein
MRLARIKVVGERLPPAVLKLSERQTRKDESSRMRGALKARRDFPPASRFMV